MESASLSVVCVQNIGNFVSQTPPNVAVCCSKLVGGYRPEIMVPFFGFGN